MGPETIFTMPELRVLRLSNNKLNGFLSEDFALLNQSLGIFEGNGNNFTGRFPVEAFVAIKNLRQLILHDTELTGTVSMELCNFKGSKRLRKLTVPPTVDCTVKRKCCDEDY